MENILFEETQKNILLVAVSVISSLFFGVLTVIQIGFHHKLGNHPAPDLLLFLFFICCTAGAVFFYFQKLKTTISETEIQVSFGLLTNKKTIRVTDIKSINVRKYDAMKEFWGWGIRYNGNTSCFTVSGDDAMEIILANDEKILIGTHKSEKMRVVADSLPAVRILDVQMQN
jgi:hypothetical protein